MGHTPFLPNGLTQRLLQKGFTTSELLASGASMMSKKDGQLIDTLRRRVVFPVRDNEGVVGFVGRRDVIIDRGGKCENQGHLPPKYMNFTDTALYRKDEALIWSTGPAGPGDQVVVVEGVMDCLAVAITASRSGRLTGDRRIVPVCTSGKNMSSGQWKAIKAIGPSRVAVALDSSDDVTRAEVEKHVCGARAAGIADVVVVNWDGAGQGVKDPAEVLQSHGAGAVMARLAAAKPLSPPLPSRLARRGREVEEMSDGALPAPPPGPDLGLST